MMTSPGRALIVLTVGLQAPLAAQEGGGRCGEDETTLYLDAPGVEDGVLSLQWGQHDAREFEVTARLRSTVEVLGYSISVETVEGPLAPIDVVSRGLNDITRGFMKTEIVPGPRLGFVSAALVCDCSLPPGDYPLARARYAVELGEAMVPSIDIAGRIEYRDGLQGSGQPVRNVLTVNGNNFFPCMEALDVRIHVEIPVFFRGDANADGVFDISDPVTLLRSQFHGDAIVRCDDAGDSNDDGKLDIADAIHVFRYLFQGEDPPPAPFPDAGWDPTPDALGCAAGMASD
jgi:hypothetical protein